MTKPPVPIDVVNLLPVLDKKLIELLVSLTPEEWEKQTIAKLWVVKDVVAHLLDTNIRILSILRDGFYGEQPVIKSRQDLLDFLNGLNADWVKAMKRVSPQMLIVLHKITGPLFCDYFKSVDPWGRSAFAVEWAGETESRNWMEIAREYTEKWLHQQQIRDAVNKPGLMTPELYYPFIDIFMLALPHTYRNVLAENGTVVKTTITTDIGGAWFLVRADDAWTLSKKNEVQPDTEIMIDPDTAWKLFSKSLRPDQIKDKVIITGNQELGQTVLNMVSVMA
ncbi:maleylpyruvate isomerase N-terminal domain-containing protein [Mucilaginibacter sp. AK015]|uniref:maleylpyruvate isomerase N-terminal domain-containing protein n=1 Tax=Mucilaginibacter sp. AK015 TaxID=2723072 RepID=UPI00161094A0|nr:maleylpyruvate isomerase N-terminal domain-containing protein [Mucilaginibacter sp. AK015]MBB5394655.1 uncharacterized protein (TIGR03083 family) [Mucilaginibacter sp. AK015]